MWFIVHTDRPEADKILHQIKNAAPRQTAFDPRGFPIITWQDRLELTTSCRTVAHQLELIVGRLLIINPCHTCLGSVYYSTMH